MCRVPTPRYGDNSLLPASSGTGAAAARRMVVDRKQFILISDDLGLNVLVAVRRRGGGAIHTEPQTTKLKF